MKTILIPLSLFFIVILAKGQDVPDALKVEKYQLKNGLTVYLNEDHSSSSVMGMVTVKGGSKRDPKDATGVAHYFEHIMFKGTEDLGTIDYKSEKVYLDSIQMMYDKLGETEGKKDRERIQLQINDLSIKAADYAIPNEVDRVVNSMGGSQLNAFTTNECISYQNTFPASEMEKWLDFYSHRFEHPVFRLFQSELETVYEEKNMYADNIFSSTMEKISQEMFSGTPYGDWPVIGKTEDIKNPSITKMKQYFETYYVPNNMALILTGDFDKEKVKPLIEQKFGVWKAKELPTPDKIEMKPFNGRKKVNMRLAPVKVELLGYKTVPEGDPDELALSVCDNLLQNSAGTGLLDELVNINKVHMVQVFSQHHEELGGDMIVVVPKLIGGSLEKSESLALEKIAALKNGDFSDQLLHDVKLELSLENQGNIENIDLRCNAIMNAFVYNEPWDYVTGYSKRLDALTKVDIVRVANKYFTGNYLALYSRTGVPKKDKIKKPSYKPVIPKNTEAVSEYAKKLESMKDTPVKPRFVEVNKDFYRGQLTKGASFYVVKNPVNDIFSLQIKYSIGTNQSKNPELAAYVLNHCGVDSISYLDFHKKLQNLGANLTVNASDRDFTIGVSGLEKNFNATLNLLNRLVIHPDLSVKEKDQLYRDYSFNKKIFCKDAGFEINALNEYALFSDESSFLNSYATKEVEKMSVDSMLNAASEILNKGVEIHYCGKLSVDDFKKDALKSLTFVNKLSTTDSCFMRDKNTPDKNVVYLLNDKNAVQSQICLFVIGENNDTLDLTKNRVFNQYFCQGISSIVFQEIREFRSLAYTAYGISVLPPNHSKPEFFMGYMSTQADKTIEALDTYVGLIRNMPEKADRLTVIKKNIKQSVNSNRPDFRNLSFDVPNWKYEGCDKDPMEKIYNHIDGVQFSDIVEYYNKYIKGKHIIITVVGDKSRINMKKLATFGKVIEMKKKDVFNM